MQHFSVVLYGDVRLLRVPKVLAMSGRCFAPRKPLPASLHASSLAQLFKALGAKHLSAL